MTHNFTDAFAAAFAVAADRGVMQAMTFPSPLAVLPKEGRSVSEKSVRTLRVMPGMAVVELRIIWPFLFEKVEVGHIRLVPDEQARKPPRRIDLFRRIRDS